MNNEKLNKILIEIAEFCNCCASKENCPEDECILFRIESIINKKGNKNYVTTDELTYKMLVDKIENLQARIDKAIHITRK